MNKIKTLSILVGILAIANIGLLVFLLSGPPKGQGNKRMRGEATANEHIQKRFGFDESQMQAFEKSKEKHRTSARKLNKELNELSRSYYSKAKSQDKLLRDSILNNINEVSNQVYKNNARHFDEVRDICNQDQLSNMKGFIDGLLTKNRARGKGRKKK